MRNVIIASGFCLLLAACGQSPNAKVTERIDYWRASLAHHVPPGSAKSAAQEWLRTQHLKVTFLEQQHWIYANVETIRDQTFPCSAWNIIVKIPVSADGRTIKNDVSAVGSCL